MKIPIEFSWIMACYNVSESKSRGRGPGAFYKIGTVCW